jgi:hypothetical protein
MWTYLEPTQGFFNDFELLQIISLFEAILPGSGTNPGAKDVQAPEYLNKLLAMDESEYYEITNWRELYHIGLKALVDQATQKYGRSVDKLSIEEVTELLVELSKGQLSGFPSSDWQMRFFSTMRGHCIEGCFSDPRWGGNKNGRMWAWYGYPNSTIGCGDLK